MTTTQHQPIRLGAAFLAALVFTPSSSGRPQEIPGERLDPASFGPSLIEDMQAVLEREAARPAEEFFLRRTRGPEDVGEWEVPSIRFTSFPHSGTNHLFNKWGDLEMSIEFPAPVNLEGAFLAGHGNQGAWARSLTVVGYRGGSEIARSLPFRDIDDTPTWFAMDLAGIDRVVFEAESSLGTDGGWYSLDDLTFVQRGVRRVLDFEDLEKRASLTGSGYAGLTWPKGAGSFADVRVVHPPMAPPGLAPTPAGGLGGPGTYGGSGTLPGLGSDFVGPSSLDPGAGWVPPDTCGAVGPQHFVSVVNQHMSVYEKASGNRIVSTSLQSFFNTGGSAGDPRALTTTSPGVGSCTPATSARASSWPGRSPTTRLAPGSRPSFLCRKAPTRAIGRTTRRSVSTRTGSTPAPSWSGAG